MSLDDDGRVKLAAGRDFMRREPPDPNRIGWSEERVAALKEHHKDGLSCAQIAKRLGGVSRNAVIGKLNRMGLSIGYVATHRKITGKMGAARRKRPSLVFGQTRSLVPIPTEPLPPPHETDIPRVAFVDLEEGQCKFICTEHPKGPYERQFCGEPRIEGLPYCTVHSQRCYGPTPPRDRMPTAARVPAFGRDRMEAIKEFEETH